MGPLTGRSSSHHYDLTSIWLGLLVHPCLNSCDACAREVTKIHCSPERDGISRAGLAPPAAVYLSMHRCG